MAIAALVGCVNDEKLNIKMHAFIEIDVSGQVDRYHVSTGNHAIHDNLLTYRGPGKHSTSA